MTLAGFFLLTDLILLLRRILKCCYALNPFFLIPITYQLITKKLLKNQSSVIRSLDIVNLKVKKTIYILKCASYTYSYKTENCQSIFTYIKTSTSPPSSTHQQLLTTTSSSTTSSSTTQSARRLEGHRLRHRGSPAPSAI